MNSINEFIMARERLDAAWAEVTTHVDKVLSGIDRAINAPPENFTHHAAMVAVDVGRFLSSVQTLQGSEWFWHRGIEDGVCHFVATGMGAVDLSDEIREARDALHQHYTRTRS